MQQQQPKKEITAQEARDVINNRKTMFEASVRR